MGVGPLFLPVARAEWPWLVVVSALPLLVVGPGQGPSAVSEERSVWRSPPGVVVVEVAVVVEVVAGLV